MFFGTAISSPIAVKQVGNNVNTAYDNIGSAMQYANRLVSEERAYNSSEAQRNRDWQEYMSNTAYTRAVSDMRNAGLNPYLAYSQGGASVGSGATASHGGISNSALNSFVGAISSVLTNQTNNINTILKNVTARENNQMSNLTKLTTSFMNNKSNEKIATINAFK